MAKTYTDLEQSKKLAEILPIESADMCFNISVRKNMPPLMTPYSRFNEFFDISPTPDFLIPCWSLAALLGILPKEIEIDGQHYAPCLFPVKSKWLLKLWYNSNYTITSPISIFSDNPVDACVEMIVKLHEQKVL